MLLAKGADPAKVFFFSIHLFEKSREYEFYPGSGLADNTFHNIVNVPLVPLWARKKGRSAHDKPMPAKYQKGAPTTGSPTGSGKPKGGREEFRAQIEVNLVGSLAVTQALLPHIRSATDRRLVNVSSINGRLAWRYIGPYIASVAASE